jgi:imidazolonepropionase-like amidohydrolase
MHLSAYAQTRPLVIRGATIFTGASPAIIEKNTIVLSKGKIQAVGTSVPIPPDAEIIEAAGMYVTPGIIDSHSHIGVLAWPGVEANDDVNEMTNPVTPQVRAVDSFNFEDPAIRRVVAGGVSTIEVFPGSANVIGGESVVLKLRPEGPKLAVVYDKAPRAMKMALGENPKRIYGELNQMPSTRMGVFFVMREAFTKARDYQAKWKKWNEKRMAISPSAISSSNRSSISSKAVCRCLPTATVRMRC